MSMKVQNQNLIQSIPKLYLHPDYADVHFEFKSNGQTALVPAHKNILAITSPIFAAMFFGPLKEKDVVEIVDATDSEFQEFLQFFYLPEVTLTMENIGAVARLADKYDMMECLNACALFLEDHLNEGNMIRGYQLAISLNHQRLKQICEEQIRKSTSKIFKSDAFLCCDEIVLEHILRLGIPCIDETDVFNGCVEWAKSFCRRNGSDENDGTNLKIALGDCFYLIHFNALTYKEIGEILSNKVCEELFTRNELAELWCAKSLKNFTNKLFTHAPRSKTWNGDNVLECVRYRTGEKYIKLNKQESTWFSTSEPLLLGGELQCRQIYRYSMPPHEFDTWANIFVIEYDAQSVSLDAEKEVLFREEVVFSQFIPSVALPQPISIRPNKMYEIRLEFANNFEGYSFDSECENQVKLDDEAVIKFHTNPLDTTSSQRGAVMCLQFNRI